MDTRAWRPYVEESASGRVLVRHPRLLERTALEVESLREPSGHVLSLEQIMAIRASNDYTEPPSALCPNKALHWTSAAKPPMRRSDPRPALPGPKPVPPPALPPPLPPARGSTSTCPPPPPLPRRSASSGSTASRTSDGSLGSERRLLSPLHNRSDAVICGQPGPRTGKAMEAADGANKDGRSHGSCLHANRVKVDGDWTKHALMCEKCGLCKCDECTAPRTLPTCWLCEKRCLCSAESTLEYATCLCCIKALFYHCMDYGDGDSSDSWADKPCAGCSQSHCALRWGCMALASLCLPCLPCYLPGRCCLKACLSAYERVGAPRCRCPNSNTVCRRPPEIPPRKPI